MAASGNRAGELGLSLIEVLVILAVTAMIAAIVFSTVSRGIRDNFGLAQDGLTAGDRALSEAAFRRMLRAAVLPYQQQGEALPTTTAGGNATMLALATELDVPAGCASADGYAVIILRVVQRRRGGQLLCESDDRISELLAWTSGAGYFAFGDGGEWHEYWPTPRNAAFGIGQPQRERSEVAVVRAPLVRFLISDGNRTKLLWVEQAGHSAPVDIGAFDAPSLRMGSFSRRNL